MESLPPFMGIPSDETSDLGSPEANERASKDWNATSFLGRARSNLRSRRAEEREAAIITVDGRRVGIHEL